MRRGEVVGLYYREQKHICGKDYDTAPYLSLIHISLCWLLAATGGLSCGRNGRMGRETARRYEMGG